jgi:N-acetyl-gamma-glutamyl-phosphate reductase common form
MNIRTVLVGARGYVGEELIEIMSQHPYLDLIAASSRELDGKPVANYSRKGSNNNDKSSLIYSHLEPRSVAELKPDLIILALPNGLAKSFVDVIDKLLPSSTIIDLSADYRFDKQWYYGLPEVYSLKKNRRISNPGCYATAIQLSIAPVKEHLVGAMSCFGVSGYSGAGTKPSDKNNIALLKNNLMPYQLTEHVHEKEVSHHLQSNIKFSPHVAEFFRGISLTSHIPLNKSFEISTIKEIYQEFYKNKPLIQLQSLAPQITQVANKNGAVLGGFSLSKDGTHLAINCVLDNLLKGAATQAVQNINLAFQLHELTGLNRM